jgi:hypothetical protein
VSNFLIIFSASDSEDCAKYIFTREIKGGVIDGKSVYFRVLLLVSQVFVRDEREMTGIENKGKLY